MLAKNQINRNKLDNKAKSNDKNIDFMPFIQNDINGHIEWSRRYFAEKGLFSRLIAYWNEQLGQI